MTGSAAPMPEIAVTPEDVRAEIARRIGYTFRDPALLDLALTHASVHGAAGPGASNERLEFLGDRVLGLAVAEMLLARFPNEAEGDIAKRFAGLVRKETLAEVAEDLDWSRFLVVESGERAARSALTESILADGVEALIAAVYQDGGWDAARAFVARFWSDRLDTVKSPPKDAKTQLQEWVQSQGGALPRYREVGRHGPSHAPVFTVEAAIDGHPPVHAEGRSKRAAEQAAAARMLAGLGVGEAQPA
jgi:ribonuclease-3